jgi:hypothetical protein
MYHLADYKEILVKRTKGYLFYRGLMFFEKRLAFLICTWYILSPAKKTRFTRCGKRMK